MIDALAVWRAVLCRPEICVDLKIVVALIDALRFAAELARKPENKAKVTAPIYTVSQHWGCWHCIPCQPG